MLSLAASKERTRDLLQGCLDLEDMVFECSKNGFLSVQCATLVQV